MNTTDPASPDDFSIDDELIKKHSKVAANEFTAAKLGEYYQGIVKPIPNRSEVHLAQRKAVTQYLLTRVGKSVDGAC